MMRRAAAAPLVLIAGPAAAHGALSGSGGFYAGALHPFLAWEHLLLLIGLGLLLGRKQPPDRVALGALALGLALGLGLSAGGVASAYALPFVLAAGVLAGVWLALGARLPAPAAVLFGAVIGAAIGLDTGAPPEDATAPLAMVWTIGGVYFGVFLIALNAMALARVASSAAVPIALRVAGSWIAAASLMVLALELRRRGGGA